MNNQEPTLVAFVHNNRIERLTVFEVKWVDVRHSNQPVDGESYIVYRVTLDDDRILDIPNETIGPQYRTKV